MKVLHVGWGFQPFRGGGLIEYAEDLMEIQVKHGYTVNYFCTGRFNIFSKTPVLKTWRNKKGYSIFELWNPPAISGFEAGVREPMNDVTEAITENYFFQVVRELVPDVIHFQEFIGIPTSLLEKIKGLNIKTIFTVEDYFFLCPTIKLVLPNSQVCRIKDQELGRQCAICCSSAPEKNLSYKLHTMYPRFFASNPVKTLKKLKRVLLNENALDDTAARMDTKIVDDFNFRRSHNLEVLKQADLVIAMSHKVAVIFNYYQLQQNMLTLNLTLKHISSIQHRTYRENPEKKIVFGVINAFNTPLKGRDLLFSLFEKIDATDWKAKVEFKIMGHIDQADLTMLKKYAFVNCFGKFKASNINKIFDDLQLDVGIVPSVWEEAYGYVGIEFLAKGLPVIGNDIGGIPDYCTDETGWLNKTCDAGGLFAIINQLVDDQSGIAIRNANLLDNRDKYIKSMETHFVEMDAIYWKLCTP